MAVSEPTAQPVWCCYIRRSNKAEDDAEVSDAVQEAVARSRVPGGAPVLVLSDSGGKNSGYTTTRPAYQRMLEMLRAGQVAGIVAYNDSRLNRNTENALALYRQCAERGIPILTDNGSGETLYTPSGRFLYTINGSVSQLYRDQQSETMKDNARRLFEDGRHRGNDPLGYRTARDDKGGVAQPRTLEMVEEEAAVVRRVFEELARRPFSETAQVLNAAGIQHSRSSRPWSKEAVKDIWRRRRFYLGYVVLRRGDEERPGHHPPILTDEEYSATVAAVNARRRARSAPRRVGRTYLLRGVAHCGSCGSRLRGEARLSRGKAWRYYTCPVSDGKSAIRDDEGNLTPCDARRVPADEAERSVVSAIEAMRLPEEAIEEQRAELARLLDHEKDGDVGLQRKRLEGVLDALRKQHQWGDLSDDEYRHERSEIEVALAALPGDDSRLERFDQTATLIRSMPEAIAGASPAALQELVALVVAQVTTAARQVVLPPQWTERARPFFEQPDASSERPRRALGARYRRDDALDWYVA